ncbi:hypothetical protein ACFSTC_47350 [Nonomuraea ferruginea]
MVSSQVSQPRSPSMRPSAQLMIVPLRLTKWRRTSPLRRSTSSVVVPPTPSSSYRAEPGTCTRPSGVPGAVRTSWLRIRRTVCRAGAGEGGHAVVRDGREHAVGHRGAGPAEHHVREPGRQGEQFLAGVRAGGAAERAVALAAGGGLAARLGPGGVRGQGLDGDGGGQGAAGGEEGSSIERGHGEFTSLTARVHKA